jgi:hypothetical protein
MEGEVQEAAVDVEAPPPARNRCAGNQASVGGVGAADRVAGKKKQEYDLPHLPEIPATWRNALRQDRASATALGAIEAQNGDGVKARLIQVLASRLPSVASVAPDADMATGRLRTPFGAIRLRGFT